MADIDQAVNIDLIHFDIEKMEPGTSYIIRAKGDPRAEVLSGLLNALGQKFPECRFLVTTEATASLFAQSTGNDRQLGELDA